MTSYTSTRPRTSNTDPHNVVFLRKERTLILSKCDFLPYSDSIASVAGLGDSWRVYSQLASVEKLVFTRCSFRTIPSWIGDLFNVKQLEVRHCPLLKTLPPEISALREAVSLLIENCNSLRSLPSTIGNLTRLRDLRITSCKSLEDLPKELRHLSSLERLSVLECTSLRTISFGVCKSWSLWNLRELRFNHCATLEIDPYDLSSLVALQTLEINHSPFLLGNNKPWYGDLQSLQEFHIHCNVMTSLPNSIRHLMGLKKLVIHRCRSLRNIPSWVGTDLFNLETLDISGCFRLKSLPKEIGHLTALQKLKITYCTMLDGFPQEIGNLPNLHKLQIDCCSAMHTLPRLIHNLPQDCLLLSSFREIGLGEDRKSSKGLRRHELDLYYRLIPFGTIKHLVLLQRARQRAVERIYRPGGPGYKREKELWETNAALHLPDDDDF